MISRSFCESLNISHPIIMAPMFLVTNTAMLKSAMDAGIMGVFPSLNFRKEGELKSVIQELNAYKPGKPGSFGVNIIVQKSNLLFEKHLAVCKEEKVPFYITSLGNPKPVIEAAHSYGAKVYCDVTNLEHAEKCAKEGCDGFIAVGQGAGGHAGPNPLQVLIPALLEKFPHIPVVAAGGLASGAGIFSVLSLGAKGVSIGTRFIACTEAGVNNGYKQAIVDAGMDDIVMTTKISGTPCTIINTPYAKKIGYEQNWLEKKLSSNGRTKKWFKALIQLRSMKNLEASVKPANYQTLWCAGKSSQLIHDIIPVAKIVENLIQETVNTRSNTQQLFE